MDETTGVDPSVVAPKSDDARVQEIKTGIRAKLLELESVAIKDRRRLKRVRRSKVLDQNIEMANQTLVNIAREYPLNIKELNTLEYAAAAVIADKMRDTPKKARKEPLWKRRLLQKVNQHRRIFTIFNKLKLGVTSRHVNKLINRTLRLARMDYSRLEEFKMKLQVRAQRLQRHKECQQQFYQNKLFKRGYQEILPASELTARCHIYNQLLRHSGAASLKIMLNIKRKHCGSGMRRKQTKE